MFEDDADMGGLESPDWKNNEELEKLNQKMDYVIEKMDIMIGHLVTIANNTRSSPLR